MWQWIGISVTYNTLEENQNEKVTFSGKCYRYHITYHLWLISSSGLLRGGVFVDVKNSIFINTSQANVLPFLDCVHNEEWPSQCTKQAQKELINIISEG